MSVVKSVIFKGEDKTVKVKSEVALANCYFKSQERCSEGPGKLLFQLGLINPFMGGCVPK